MAHYYDIEDMPEPQRPFLCMAVSGNTVVQSKTIAPDAATAARQFERRLHETRGWTTLDIDQLSVIETTTF